MSTILLSTTLSALPAVVAQEEFRQREFVEQGKPKILDSHLKVEQVAGGLDTPTTMAFLGPNDILVLEKDKGTVQRIVNGKMLGQPLLDVNVASSVERGMCGIAISKHDSKTYVFLYYTEIRMGTTLMGGAVYLGLLRTANRSAEEFWEMIYLCGSTMLMV